MSYFLPGKVDDDNSSYQVFLRFNFEFGEAKINPKAIAKSKTIKATKTTRKVKEAEEVKETKKADDIEQTLDELIAADVEALEELNQ